MKQNGFTLVELAIVLMIIGLLIGGILKGQEMIQNARIVSFMGQLKSYDAAVITFQDSYGAKPGDITSPATRLPNCSAASCNIAGDGNGVIGVNFTGTGAWSSDEQNTFWLHLQTANLISGVDLNSTWSSADYFVAAYPETSLGGNFYILHYNYAPTARYPRGIYGHHLYIGKIKPAGALDRVIPLNQIARIEQKIDNGHPWTGDIVIDSAACGIAIGETTYHALSTNCDYLIKTGF